MRHWTDTAHNHGALAGIELVSNASALPNYYTREMPFGPSHTPVTYSHDPIQARAMDLDDVREFRRWHRDAVFRSRDAGFDLVYLYCGHDITMPMDFLARVATTARTITAAVWITAYGFYRNFSKVRRRPLVAAWRSHCGSPPTN